MLFRSDILGRYGGEEFAILFPETDLASAIEAAERVRRHIIQQKIPTQAEEIKITISGGISELPLDQKITLDQLIDRADKSLYAAKQKRDCLGFWNQKIEKPTLAEAGSKLE